MSGNSTNRSDGEPGHDTGEREAVLRSAGSAEAVDPAARRLYAGMQRDRAVLRSLEAEPAPAGLLERAIGRALEDWGSETGADEGLRADVLARLGEGEAVDDRLPESAVVPARMRWWDGASRTVRRAGLLGAAVLALAAGVAALRAVSLMSERDDGPPRVAHGDGGVPGAGAADRETDAGFAGSTGRVGAGTAGVGGAADPSPVLAMGEPVGSFTEGAALMSEGRLLILARGGSADRVIPGLEAMTRRRVGSAHSFAMAAGLPAGVLDGTGLAELSAPVLASGSNEGLRVTLPQRSGWLGTLRPTPNALASLVAGLRDAGLSVEMLRLAEAVRLESTPSAEDVLWWSRPPTVWRPPVAVPVVIETLE